MMSSVIWLKLVIAYLLLRIRLVLFTWLHHEGRTWHEVFLLIRVPIHNPCHVGVNITATLPVLVQWEMYCRKVGIPRTWSILQSTIRTDTLCWATLETREHILCTWSPHEGIMQHKVLLLMSGVYTRTYGRGTINYLASATTVTLTLISHQPYLSKCHAKSTNSGLESPWPGTFSHLKWEEMLCIMLEDREAIFFTWPPQKGNMRHNVLMIMRCANTLLNGPRTNITLLPRPLSCWRR